MMERNTYQDILDNFDKFCDDFENAAAERFSGQDEDSRTPISHDSVTRVTPEVVREVEPLRREDLIAGETTVDVQAT
mgnify:FL=1|tara:strand:- start:572 stop:802 length:231 start_codon:yes stop_codon:yes gene_type:complete